MKLRPIAIAALACACAAGCRTTKEVLRDYERRYPGVVRVVYEERNQWNPNARYIAQTLADNVPFATLLTNDFIVNGVELVSYTELKDIRSVQPTFIPRVHRVVIGDPLMTAASLAANYAGDKYLESKGVNSETQFDYLMMECADGKKRQFGVQHKDLEAVLNLLQEIAPHIRLLPPASV